MKSAMNTNPAKSYLLYNWIDFVAADPKIRDFFLKNVICFIYTALYKRSGRIDSK